MAVDKLTNN